MSYAPSVPRDAEFDRIFDLPRRVWTEGEALEAAEAISDALRTPRGQMTLKPEQAIMISEAYEHGGLIAGAPVGTGKTIPHLLTASFVEAANPLWILPAALRKVTCDERIPELARHWKLHPALLYSEERVISAQMIQSPNNQKLIRDLDPDWVFVDEAHFFKAMKTARYKRLFEFVLEKPDTKLGFYTGSLSSGSIKDPAPLWVMANPIMYALPRDMRMLALWAAALDENVEVRARPGALLDFCTPEEVREYYETDELGPVRRGVRRRMAETPGAVFFFTDSAADVSLEIEIVAPGHADYPPPDPKIDAAFRKLRRDAELPGSEWVADAPAVWRTACQLKFGFYLRWKWEATKMTEKFRIAWLDARKQWKRFVRDSIAYTRRDPPLDSEEIVRRAIEDGDLADWAWQGYQDVGGDRARPPTAVTWLTDSVVEHFADLALREPCIVWTGHPAFGHRLSKLSGLRYFGAGARDLEQFGAETNGKVSVIASIHAQKEGVNLQPWSRNIVASPPAGARTWEQMLGRTHRYGQRADEVWCSVFLGCAEALDAFKTARATAAMLEDSFGPQKLTKCSDVIGMPKPGEVFRWKDGRYPAWGIKEESVLDALKTDNYLEGEDD